MSIQIGLREMNQQFTEYMQMVEQGEEILVTRRGVPIAKVIPYAMKKSLSSEQVAAKKRCMARMRRGFKSKEKTFKRDDLYDR